MKYADNHTFSMWLRCFKCLQMEITFEQQQPSACGSLFLSSWLAEDLVFRKRSSSEAVQYKLSLQVPLPQINRSAPRSFSALPAQAWVAPHNPMASSSPKPNCQNTTFFFSKGRYRPVPATISPDAAHISAYSKACSKSRERASALTGEIPLFRKFIA